MKMFLSLSPQNLSPRFAATRHVLIADTYSPTRYAFQDNLEQRLPNGDTIEVHGVDTQEEAWKVMEKTPCDVIVTASKLPELGDGLKFIQDIRTKLGQHPLVLMWTADLSMNERRVKEAGGNAFFEVFGKYGSMKDLILGHLSKPVA